MFKNHKLKKVGPGNSWFFAEPGTNNMSFRVTWIPGNLFISGDAGDITYTVWPSFGTLWGAVDLVHRAGPDYLTGKSGVSMVYDEQKTIQSILSSADNAMKWDDFSQWEAIVDNYGYPSSDEDHRNGATQMQAAANLRNRGMMEHEAHELEESAVHEYPHWVKTMHAASQIWAKEMLRRKPIYVKAHESYCGMIKWFKDLKRYPIVRNPVMIWHDPKGKNRHFSDSSSYHVYTAIPRKNKEKSWTWFAEIKPLVFRGRDLSKYGLYRSNGCGTSGEDMVRCPKDKLPYKGYSSGLNT